MFIGVLLIYFLSGQTVSIMTMVGFVMLVLIPVLYALMCRNETVSSHKLSTRNNKDDQMNRRLFRCEKRMNLS